MEGNFAIHVLKRYLKVELVKDICHPPSSVHYVAQRWRTPFIPCIPATFTFAREKRLFILFIILIRDSEDPNSNVSGFIFTNNLPAAKLHRRVKWMFLFWGWRYLFDVFWVRSFSEGFFLLFA